MKQTLQHFKHKDFYDSAVALFEKLGIPLNKPTREPIDLSLLGEHKSLEHIQNAYLIGQVDDAIFEGKSLHVNLKDGKYEGLLLFGVTLKKQNPTRTELADISRTFNRAFKYLPVVILFSDGDKLSLSSTERSEYKISKEGEKVGKVNILRNIAIQNPHAGHIKILQALIRNTKTKTYDELYQHWQKTLNISIVTKEFYTKLFELFTELQNTITYPNESQKEFFIITLLGRILFLRFLHAKGLIPDEKFEVKDEYYHLTLEPLFFEILNKPIEKRFVHFKEENIPFLNGGLFENTTSDYYKLSELARTSEYIGILKLPDAWFRALYELFDSYIFTVDENTSSDIEVALDPELLGRVFENLLASVNPETKESARKATGSYYTPREIVDYMVSSSLKEYLKTKTTIDETKLESLCFNKTCDFEPSEKTQILQAILELKVLDPACGSGAFPMGLLNHLVAMLDAIDFKEDEWFSLQSKEFKEKHKDRDKNYIRKLSIIQNSIFGVDIQPIAIEISKLRFFLSLIVDESNDKIEPLPNMEFKFVCANTLLPLQKKGQMSLITSDYTHIEKELKRIKEAYFNTTDRDEKERLKKAFLDNLKALRHEIGLDFDNKLDTYNPFDVTSSAEFFDMDYMFGISEGFDIVIGNPPYVFARSSTSKGMSKKEKDFFYMHYKLAQYQINLYTLFVEKGTKLLKDKGVLTFITPNNWLTINTNKDFREFILQYSSISIVNCLSKVFESASVDSAIVIFSKELVRDKVGLYEYTHENSIKHITNIDSSYFLGRKDAIINMEAFKNEDIYGLLDKIEGNTLPLNQVADIKAGLKAYETGKGNPPQTEAMKKNRVYHAKEALDESYFTYLDGKDVSRYALGWSGEFLKYGENLAAPRKFELFSTPRILVRQIPSKPPYCIHACYTNEVLLNDLNSMNIVNITKHPLFILALLNSRLLSFWFVHKFGKLSRGIFPQFKINELEQFPIAQTDNETPFIDLVDKILTCKAQNPKADTSELEAQVDKMVYALYGLTEEEINIIEDSAKK